MTTIATNIANRVNAGVEYVKTNPVKTAAYVTTAAALAVGGYMAYQNADEISAFAQPYINAAGDKLATLTEDAKAGALSLAERVFTEEQLVDWGFKVLPPPPPPAPPAPVCFGLWGYGNWQVPCE